MGQYKNYYTMSVCSFIVSINIGKLNCFLLFFVTTHSKYTERRPVGVLGGGRGKQHQITRGDNYNVFSQRVRGFGFEVLGIGSLGLGAWLVGCMYTHLL